MPFVFKVVHYLKDRKSGSKRETRVQRGNPEQSEITRYVLSAEGKTLRGVGGPVSGTEWEGAWSVSLQGGKGPLPWAAPHSSPPCPVSQEDGPYGRHREENGVPGPGAMSPPPSAGPAVLQHPGRVCRVFCISSGTSTYMGF